MRSHIPPAPIVEEDPLMLEDGSHATVLTINDRMCRWPIGDPAENEFHFCGRKPKTGSPYCEAHARKAYQPQQQRRNDKGRRWWFRRLIAGLTRSSRGRLGAMNKHVAKPKREQRLLPDDDVTDAHMSAISAKTMPRSMRRCREAQR